MSDFADWTSGGGGGGGGGYASLTGAGQTTTPGKLTQAGEFDVTGKLSVDSGSNSIILNNSGGQDASGNGVLIESEPGTNPQMIHLIAFGGPGPAQAEMVLAQGADPFGYGSVQFVTNGAALMRYGNSSLDRGDSFFAIQDTDGGINAFAAIYVNHGSPSGVITPKYTGSLCIDTSTPGLWIATGHTFNTDWSMYTRP